MGVIDVNRTPSGAQCEGMCGVRSHGITCGVAGPGPPGAVEDRPSPQAFGQQRLYFVTLADAADALAVSTRTVRRYIADGQLEAVRSAARLFGSRSNRSSGSSTPRPSGFRQAQPPRLAGLKRRQERPNLAAPCSP